MQTQITRRLSSLTKLSILLVFAALMAACGGPFSLVELVDGPEGTALSVSPGSGTVMANRSVELVASGGYPPYAFEIASGNGSLSGNIFLSPATAGFERIRVVDSVGNTVEVQYDVDTGPVGLGMNPRTQSVYTGDAIAFHAVGGTGPFEFSFAAAGDNQSGATLDPVTGAYVAGRFAGTDTITVTDRSDSSSVTATITVQARSIAISPSASAATSSAPTNTIEFHPVGGTGPFTFSFAAAGDNQSGATLDSVTGAYTAGPSTGVDTITLTDTYDNRTVTATVGVTAGTFVANVNYDVDPIINIASARERFSDAFSAETTIWNVGDAAGAADLLWTVYASPDGAINGPDDMIVDSDVITGGIPASGSSSVLIGGNWPSVEGNYFLIIEVSSTDEIPGPENLESSGSQIMVRRPLAIAPTSFSLLTGEQVAFVADGAIASLSWDLQTSGAGGSVDAAGLYTAGSAAGTDVVRVTDTNDGSVATATVTVGAKSLAVSPTSATATTGAPTNAISFQSIGGTGPFTFSFAAAGDNQSGATLDSVTGAYTAGPAAGVDTITLTDSYDGRTAISSVTVLEATVFEDVDYAVGPVDNVAGTILAGQSVTADFDVTNLGSATGSADIFWTAYASIDQFVGGTDDVVIDSGSIAGDLGAGASLLNIPISGNWPLQQDDYWLLVTASSADEIPGGNNKGVTASPISVIRPVSISPTSVTVYAGQDVQFNAQGGGTAYTWDFDPAPSASGGSVDASGLYTAGGTPANDVVRVTDDSNGTQATATITVTAVPLPNSVNYQIDTITVTSIGTVVGNTLDGTLDISNTTTGTGGEDIAWNLYASLDGALGAGDEFVASGTTSSLTSTESRSVPFSGVWPSVAGEYSLIATIAADDETNAVGNEYAQPTPTMITNLPPADVDYRVSVVPAGGTRSPESTISESFTLENAGTAGGSADLFWDVYLSDDGVFNAGDVRLQSGTIAGGLAGGSPSGAIPIDGTWPLATGSWPFHLIVRISASDDIDVSNNAETSGEYYKQVTGADLTVTSITKDNPNDFVGAPVDETFTISNIGDAASGSFTWTVYASDDASFGGDVELDSGSSAGLGVGAALGPKSISSVWPALAPANLPTHLFVEIQPAVADADPANDRVGGGPYSVIVPPDYSVVSTAPVLHVVSEGGNTAELLSDVGAHEFTIEKVSGADGSKPIVWNAYLSRSPSLDGTEIPLGGGVEDPIVAPATSTTVAFDPTWVLPADPEYGYWHIIVTISAGDDTNGANDTYVSVPIPVWSLTGSGESDTSEDDVSFALADDFGILLNVGDTVEIGGLVDDTSGFRDSFLATVGTAADGVGTDVTELWVRIEQFYTPSNPPQENDADIYVFDRTGASVAQSIEIDAYIEPFSTMWLVAPVVPGETYFLDVVEINAASPGVPYTMYVEAH